MVPAPEWTTKEVNTRAFKAGLLYLKRQLGQLALESFCLDTGLSYEYLVDENNWVSVAWLNRFYTMMVTVTGKPQSPYECGLFATDPEVWGSIYFLFRAVGSPGFLYRKLCELTPDFNKNAAFELVKLERNQAELRWHSRGEHPFVCDNRRGQLAAVPAVWGLPPAEIEEDECCARGGRYCHYRISWANRSAITPALAVGGLAALTGWLGAIAVGSQPRWLLVVLCGLCGSLGARIWDLSRTERENSRFNQLQSDKLKRSMQDLEREYDEVRKASQVIEDLNVNLEQKVEERTAELQKAQAELETSYRKLQDLDRLKTQFFSNITHELRTPLTMILAPLQGLLDGDVGSLRPQQKDYLRPIQQNALKLLKLINDLLDLAKIEEDYLRLRIQQTDMVGLVTEIVEQARPLAARKDIGLELEIRRTHDDLQVDLERMERALVNLVSNALKFTEPGGHVRVRMDASDNEVQISVKDNGIGIPEDELDRVFERFSQADGSVTRRYGGTGIGLALAKEIVELHGGRISIESKEGEGSEFTVHLKRGDAHLRPEILDRRQSTRPESVGRRGEDREPREWTRRLLENKDFRFLEIAEATERRIAERGDTGPKLTKILVVEDNPDVLRFVNQQLREEHDVYLAQDGAKGLELAARELPDVIITDYMMPEMDGLSLLRTLRANPRTANIPAIVLTAKSDVQDRIDARQAGAEIYLSKPFNPRELRTAVGQLLKQRGRQLSNTLHEQVKSLELISAGLAHEIHNPLNYIRNSLFVIGEVTAEIQSVASDPERTKDLATVVHASRDKVTRMYEIALRGTERIAKTVELVRNYAREGFPHTPTPLCIDDAIRDMARLISPARYSDVQVKFDLQAAGATVSCIPEEMQQAIGNLWQNALDATGSEGKVEIRTRLDGSFLQVEVIDNGCGIARDQLDRIFIPFFSTKSSGQGLGLGLAIAYQVITKTGGSLTVESVEHQGSTFRARLPLLPLERQASSAGEHEPTAVSSEQQS
jgi:signal transduction histidine kinase